MGGIASGKSTICALLASHGLILVDADRIAAQVSERPEVLARLRELFPADLFDATGRIDRPAMATLIFNDQPAKQALEGVLHPLIRDQIMQSIDSALAQGHSVALDAPLLLEGGLIDRCDACIYVQTTASERRSRAQARGWTAEELRQREANQTSESVKIARSAYTIGNSGALAKTRDRVLEVLASLESHPQRGRAT